jgi:hypothetical protein
MLTTQFQAFDERAKAGVLAAARPGPMIAAAGGKAGFEARGKLIWNFFPDRRGDTSREAAIEVDVSTEQKATVIRKQYNNTETPPRAKSKISATIQWLCFHAHNGGSLLETRGQ